MRIQIQLLTFMRIRIQLITLMRTWISAGRAKSMRMKILRTVADTLFPLGPAAVYCLLWCRGPLLSPRARNYYTNAERTGEYTSFLRKVPGPSQYTFITLRTLNVGTRPAIARTRKIIILNISGAFWPKLVERDLLAQLKVLSNEKRGGLTVVTFDRSPFKLFTLRFSSKSVQAPSCERQETTQQSLFLSFEINNCLPITV